MGRHWKDKYVIGLTGNIAMGKSLVLRMLQHLGAYTIDADALTHRVMAPNAPAYKPIVQTFGQFILTPQKEIDRNKLASIAFSDPEALKKLEAITHPLIRGAVDMLVKRSDKYVVVVEAIKLVEGELANQVDSIWVVDSSPENQIKRLVEKRGMSVDTAKRRVMLQNPQKEKLSRANVVITNNETPEKTWLQVQAAWRNIPGLPQEKETQTVATVTVEPTPPQPPVTPVSTLATAVPTPQPPAATPPLAITSFDVKRPQPKDFDKIAALINKVKGTSLDRNDIMAHFGEKTYLLAESNNTPLGVIAYLVENLITRVDEFVVEPAAPAQAVGQSLIKAMEESAEELQSEVVFVFLSHHVESVKPIFEKREYQETSVESIQYPIWREAVKESKPQGASIFSKRLREKPIQVPI